MSRFAVVCSTGGAVLGRLLGSTWFADRCAVVLTDRPCGAEDRARTAGVPVVRCEHADRNERDTAMAGALESHGVDHAFLFYTRLVGPGLLGPYGGRLWNLHPSLLPSFPGLHGFADAVTAGRRIAGTTLHVVDDGCDTGAVLCQTAYALDPRRPFGELRHQVFQQQVRTALQTARWLDADRVTTGPGTVEVADAPGCSIVDGALYSPGLDDPEAATTPIPYPGAPA